MGHTLGMCMWHTWRACEAPTHALALATQLQRALRCAVLLAATPACPPACLLPCPGFECTSSPQFQILAVTLFFPRCGVRLGPATGGTGCLLGCPFLPLLLRLPDWPPTPPLAAEGACWAARFMAAVVACPAALSSLALLVCACWAARPLHGCCRCLLDCPFISWRLWVPTWCPFLPLAAVGAGPRTT